MTEEDAASNIAKVIKEIWWLAEGRPGDDPEANLAKIRTRSRDILRLARSDLHGQLTELIAVRNAGTPSDPWPFPSSVMEVADEIATFVGRLEDSGSARELRALLIARLTEICDERREQMRKAEQERQRLVIETIMATVAANHLYPALRAAGIEDPESVWELRGRFDDDDAAE